VTVDRICPFLALAADHRTAVDGYDPDHVCHALRPPEGLDRARQAELCLSETHRQCDRYVAFLAAHAADAPAIPTPSADALIPRTRLVVEPDARRVPGLGEAPMGLSPRRWVVAGGVALVGVAAAATAVAGGFGGAPSRQADATMQPTATPTVSARPSESSAPSVEPTLEPSSSQPSEPTPRPTRSAAEPTATPAPTTYVVQEGDTLNGIATQFGTTAEAIRQANGLPGDVINIGQVLIIP
jgi:nucleoid-associated protein YgaU